MTTSDDHKKDPTQPDADKDFATLLDENDPHTVEKLANVGKDVDVAEASE